MYVQLDMYIYISILYILYMSEAPVQSRVAAGFSQFSKYIPKPFLMYMYVAERAGHAVYMTSCMWRRELDLYMYMYLKGPQGHV